MAMIVLYNAIDPGRLKLVIPPLVHAWIKDILEVHFSLNSYTMLVIICTSSPMLVTSAPG